MRSRRTDPSYDEGGVDRANRYTGRRRRSAGRPGDLAADPVNASTTSFNTGVTLQHPLDTPWVVGQQVRRTERGTLMKKFGFTGIIVSGLAAAVLGLAAPAQADYGHHDWVGNMGSSVYVPQVNSNAH